MFFPPLVLETDRDPRLGRNMEAYTEDPYLYSRIATDYRPRGLKDRISMRRDKVVALMTDFPTQSEPVSGMERGAIEVVRAQHSRDLSCPRGLRRSRPEHWA